MLLICYKLSDPDFCLALPLCWSLSYTADDPLVQVAAPLTLICVLDTLTISKHFSHILFFRFLEDKERKEGRKKERNRLAITDLIESRIFTIFMKW